MGRPRAGSWGHTEMSISCRGRQALTNGLMDASCGPADLQMEKESATWTLGTSMPGRGNSQHEGVGLWPCDTADSTRGPNACRFFLKCGLVAL